MPTSRTRDSLLLAKKQAVEQFLKAAEPRAALRASFASVRPEHNVVGVGVGTKLVEGHSNGAPCVRFYVERKVAKESIPPEHLLPTTINSIETDVIETGRFVAFQLCGCRCSS